MNSIKEVRKHTGRRFNTTPRNKEERRFERTILKREDARRFRDYTSR